MGLAQFPWQMLNTTLIDFTFGGWIPDLVNPSPFVLDNGTTLYVSVFHEGRVVLFAWVTKEVDRRYCDADVGSWFTQLEPAAVGQ